MKAGGVREGTRAAAAVWVQAVKPQLLQPSNNPVHRLLQQPLNVHQWWLKQPMCRFGAWLWKP